MINIRLRLPDSLHQSLRDLAERDNVSINQFITTAVAEKVSALATESYLNERAKRADKRKFKKVLAKVSKRPPRAGDEL
jgi:hypothetical protein